MLNLKEKSFLNLNQDLKKVDSLTYELINLEEIRQREKIILIASESICPSAVREALSSVFSNLYAEGYPSMRLSREEESQINNYAEQLIYYKRFSNKRYYKGCEYADLIEILAQKRCADLFASLKTPASSIYVNVQPLSGASANNAVYSAFLNPGDLVMGMSLSQGGHLTHGSPANRSGKCYRIVSYGVDPETEQLNYEEIEKLAKKYRPKMIIAGFSAYPWAVDWEKFSLISKDIEAVLMADISHPCGLIAAGLYPNPIDYADVITFTTHKTLCGPRGAVIITKDEKRAKEIDSAVFPGEQGGPHIQSIAAKAVAFEIAKNQEFKNLQERIIENTKTLAKEFKNQGLKLAYGGTNTHMVLIDLKGFKQEFYPLSGEIASRILDLAGITCNKNTILGDTDPIHPSGLRFGTTWTTQRGMKEKEMQVIAKIICLILGNIKSFSYIIPQGRIGRGKIDFKFLNLAKDKIFEILEIKEEEQEKYLEGLSILEVSGKLAFNFLQSILTQDISKLKIQEGIESLILNKESKILVLAGIFHFKENRYLLVVDSKIIKELKFYLQALSDGYILFDEDIYAKIEGPVMIQEFLEISSSRLEKFIFKIKSALKEFDFKNNKKILSSSKTYFIGQKALIKEKENTTKEEFFFKAENTFPQKTCLYKEHLKLIKRELINFAGFLLPLWYNSAREEHQAARKSAALFDVSHMGILEIKGPGAGRFLDLATTNYIFNLNTGQAHYSYILDSRGKVLDDIFLYCRGENNYMLVVNAVNTKKILAYFKALKEKKVVIDINYPSLEIDNEELEIIDLKEQKVDLALQGPNALLILKNLIEDEFIQRKLTNLKKSEFIEFNFQGMDLMISKTGYTGEEVGYEIYLHPKNAPFIWNLILEKGAYFGIKPAGLAARDSARVEAGFPLYGHELAGDYDISPIEAGYGAFIKFHKPFFIGKNAILSQAEKIQREIIRFKVSQKGIRMIRPDDLMIDQKGTYIGRITSLVLIENIQIGMAWVKTNFIKPQDEISILPKINLKEKIKEELNLGDKVFTPYKGEILSRFKEN